MQGIRRTRASLIAVSMVALLIAIPAMATVYMGPKHYDFGDDVTIDGNLTVAGTQSFTGDATLGNVITTSGVGTVSGTGVSAVEYAAGVHRTVITLADTEVTMADNAGVVAYGSLKVYDWPAGAITILGATTDLDLTLSAAGINADWDGDVGVGTVAANNGATLASTEQNIVPTTATPQASSSATTANAQSTGTESGSVFDGTSTAADVYLNLLVDDADHDITTTPTNIVVNGTMTVFWSNLGDY